MYWHRLNQPGCRHVAKSLTHIKMIRIILAQSNWSLPGPGQTMKFLGSSSLINALSEEGMISSDQDVKSCKVLDAVAARRLHKDIDDFFGWLISSGKVQAYMTVPFIVERSALAKNSTIQIWA